MENQSEFFYEKLKNTQLPNQVLLELLSEVTGRQITRAEIIMINKLLKLFGRFTLFFSILDLSNVKHLEGSLYGILYTICRNRFEKSHSAEIITAFESLNREISSIERQIEKLKGEKIKPPSSKGLE